MAKNKNKQKDKKKNKNKVNQKIKKNTSLILSRVLVDALFEVEKDQLYGLNRSQVIRSLLTEKLIELGYIKKPN